jgi:hypothetical protein
MREEKMSDHLYINVKVGDIVYNPDKPHMSIFDGMLVDYKYTPDWKNNEFIFSDNMLKTFAVCEVPLTWLPYLKEMVKHQGDCDDMEKDSTFRHRKGVIPLNDIATKIASADLVAKLRGENVVPIIDLRFLNDPTKLIKDSSTLDFNVRKRDNNLITSGSYDIGSGGDYGNFVDLIADIGVQNGDIDGQLISDITTASNIAYQGVSGYKLLFHSDTPHNGNRNAGHQENITQSSWQYRITSNGTLEAKDYLVRRSVDVTGDSRLGIFSNVHVNCTLKVHDMYIKGGDNFNWPERFGVGIRSQASGATVNAWNCVIWHCANGILVDGNTNAASQFSNNTVVNNVVNFLAFNIACLYRSNIAFEHFIDFADWWQPGNATGQNNASSDDSGEDGDFGTGSDNKSNLTSGNEIEMTTTADDFCHPKEGSNVATGGNTTHQSATDMAGVTWDASDPSIGAFQFPPDGGGRLVGGKHIIGAGLEGESVLV